MSPEQLRELMDQQEWSHSDVATILMCSKWSVYKYLSGERTISKLAAKVLRDTAEEVNDEQTNG